MKKKYLMLGIAWMLVVSHMLSGCKFVREVDMGAIKNPQNVPTQEGGNSQNTDGMNQEEPSISKEIQPFDWNNLPSTEGVVSVAVKDGPSIDTEAVLQFFYGEGKDGLIKDGFLIQDEGTDSGGFNCERDGVELSYAEKSNLDTQSIYVVDKREAAGMRYREVLGLRFLYNEISQVFLDIYPEEDLESCSREEAIAACAPLAKAMGYEEAQVNVYAMKKEILNNFAKLSRAEKYGLNFSAPDPEYDYKYVEEQEEEALQNGDYDKLFGGDEDEKIEWTNRTEAYILVYRSVWNDLVMDTANDYMLLCVYVPAYGRVVYADGTQSLVHTNLKEKELISAEEAVAEVLRVQKIVSEKDIIVRNISLVYSPRAKQIMPDLEQRVIDPCWRIDYQLSEDFIKRNPNDYETDDGTILINAVDGRENLWS